MDLHDAVMSDHFEKFVDVPGGYLYCRSQGHGRDVVLLNPGAADLRVWDSTIPWLTEIARVTAFDYRDTGLSSAGKAPYSEVDDIAAAMDAVGVRSAVLIGVSDGARRGLAFAHRYPDRADHVIAIGGAFGDFPNPSPAESAARAVMNDHFARRAVAHKEQGIHAAAEADIRGWGGALDEFQHRKMVGLQVANSYWIDLPDADYLGRELDPPVRTRFAEITRPISVVVGTRDFEGTRLWAQRIADQAPDATLTVLPDADHFPMLSAPAEFERIVREVLTR